MVNGVVLCLLLLALCTNIYILSLWLRPFYDTVSDQGMTFWQFGRSKRIAWSQIEHVAIDPNTYTMHFSTAQGNYKFNWHHRSKLNEELSIITANIPATKFSFITSSTSPNQITSAFHSIANRIPKLLIALIIWLPVILFNLDSQGWIALQIQPGFSPINIMIGLNMLLATLNTLGFQYTLSATKIVLSRKQSFHTESMTWREMSSVRSWPHGDLSTDSFIEFSNGSENFCVHLDDHVSNQRIRQQIIESLERFQLPVQQFAGHQPKLQSNKQVSV